MAVTAGTEFRRPDRYEDFETNCMKLGKVLINTSNVNKVGRKGQPQKGVDVWGYRDRNIEHVVGIQCKLKSLGKVLDEAEVRDEWNKALTFNYEIKEFFILTTADNDVKMEELARDLSLELFKTTGRSVEFYVWGWQRICDEIVDYPDLIRAFDPDYGPYSREHSEKLDDVLIGQEQAAVKIDVMTEMVRKVVLHMAPGTLDDTISSSKVDEALDRQVDGYRTLLQEGLPRTAKSLFEKMLVDVGNEVAPRVLFRIKANIGACHLALDEVGKGCELLLEAYNHAPEEPKAITNQALAYLLKGDFQRVLEIGAANFDTDTANPDIWAHVVQAAGRTGFPRNPLELVPAKFHDSEGVMVAVVHFDRGRGDANWRTKAGHVYTLFPDSRYARQFYADSILEAVGAEIDGRSTGIVPANLKAPLEAAAEIYRDIWDETTKGELVVGSDDFGVLANLFVALRLLKRNQDSIDLIVRERERIEQDQDTLLRAAIAAHEAGSSLVDDLLPLLAPGEATSMLTVQSALRHANWALLAELDDNLVGAVADAEKVVCRTAVDLCRAWNTAGGAPGEADLAPAVQAAADDPRASILAAQLCETFGLPGLSDRAWQNARKSVRADSHWTSRASVAKHAYRLRRWRDASDLYTGIVDQDIDSEELRNMAVAVACEAPQKGRGARFFRDLPASVRSKLFYRHYEAVMLFNSGDLKKAEKAARATLKDSRQLYDFRLVCLILRRLGRAASIRGLVNGMDLLSLEGSLNDRMFAAQVLHEAGRVPAALKEMYRLYHAHRDNSDLALGFFIMMMDGRSYRHIPRPKAVELDAWVRAVDEHGHELEFTVGEDASPADHILPVTNAIVMEALGKEVDETFSRHREAGGNAVWTIKEIRHRWSHAAWDIGENFETRFPDVSGVYRYTLKENDIQPVLDMVRSQAEANEKFAQNYLNGLPLSFVAGKLHRDTIGFAGLVRSLGHEIRTCLGNHHERIRALDAVVKRPVGGAVLDTYTAWVAASLDVLPVLKQLFGRLVVPQAVKDDLLLMRGFDRPNSKALSLTYRDGEFFKHEVAPDDVDEWRAFVSQRLAKIEEFCEIAPVAAPLIVGEAADERTEILDMAIENFGAGVLDAAAIAADGHVLLTEDMHYRNFAGIIWPIKSTWLQPTLSYAVHCGLMSFQDYTAKLVELAHAGHGFVSFDASILIETMRPGTDDALANFTIASNFIGTPTADLMSHVRVVRACIEGLAAQVGIPYLMRLKASSVLLDKLIRNHADRHGEILVAVLVGVDETVQPIVSGWIAGHFLLPEAERAYAEYCKRTLTAAIRTILSRNDSYVGNLQRLGQRRKVHLPAAFLRFKKS